MNKKLENILNNYGLNEKEISMYLSSLSLGTTNMTKIAKMAKLKRPTAYLIYESLEKKGLMSSYRKSSGMQFLVKEPSILYKKAQQNLEDIKNIIPELKAIENKNRNKPKMTYYEGIENYKEVVEDILRFPNETVYIIGNLDSLFEILTKKYDEDYFIPKRISQNIYVKAILPNNTDDFIRKMKHDKEKREVKYLPPKYKLNSFTMIYNNKIVTIDVDKDIFITVIENVLLAEDEKTKFEMLWNGL